MRVNYVIAYVSDMARSVTFYRDVMGLPLRFETPGWTEFATDGATLALHVSKGLATTEANHERPGQWRSGFTVENLDEFHSRMVRKGVPCVQEPREVFGARIAQYLDPDGLPISVGEEKESS